MSKGYFQMLGANFLDLRIAPMIGPGSVELNGVLALQEESLTVVFDLQERWRRGVRRKQMSRALNTSDFYIHDHADFAQPTLQIAVASTLYKSNSTRDSSGVLHPCLPKGVTETFPIVGAPTAEVKFQGDGDAKSCIQLLGTFIDHTNKECPKDGFCLLNSVSQPRPLCPFFATGIMASAVRFAHEVVTHLQLSKDEVQGFDDATLPTLGALQNAATHVCAVPKASLDEWRIQLGDGRSVSYGCFELCESIALLRQLGVRDDEKKVVFGEPRSINLTELSSGIRSVERKVVVGTDVHESAWLVGTFLYLNLLQRRKDLSLEADMLAIRVGEGMPIGTYLSILLLVGACVYVYVSTGARSIKGKRSGGYRRVNNSSGEQERYTTSSIMFLDDASE
ncbi:hypothetical protein PINS_up017873 [Pythium insidiosum]|nr:hypothetical protein PINS_up017873 [Pythium insidiosum]